MISQVLDERRIPSLARRPRDRPLPLLDDRLDGLGERPADAPPRPAAGARDRPQRQPREHPRAARPARAAAAAASPRSTDTELLTALLADEPAPTRSTPCVRVLPRVRGAFSLVILDEQRVIGVRDPHGFRPLVLGRLPRAGDGAAGPGLWGDDTAGWMPRLRDGRRSTSSARSTCATSSRARSSSSSRAASRVSVRYARGDARAVRVRAHLLRPPGLVHGGPQPVRGAAADGRCSWRIEHPADADLVMPVPDTGAPAAAGYAEASGIPYREGMVRNRYSGRTFIQPSQAMRQRGVNVKLSPLREVVRDRSLDRRRRLDRARHDHQADRRAAAARRRAPRSTCGSARRRSTTRASTASTPRSRPS